MVFSKRMAGVVLICMSGCIVGCVSEGAGWRMTIGNPFTIEYTNLQDQDGKQEFRQDFVEWLRRPIAEWLVPAKEVATHDAESVPPDGG